MNTAIILALIAFVFAPFGLIIALALKKGFETRVFGRIYAWQGPWRIVTEDETVKEQYEQLQRRMLALSAVLIAALMGVVAFVTA
ncbi:MAG: hypothetical protein AAF590_05500 [Pseudomonadota bacterium]